MSSSVKTERGRAGSGQRRRRDLNPRGTKPPLTVFETAAFDRSATPPKTQAYRGTWKSVFLLAWLVADGLDVVAVGIEDVAP
jgi:hypothetical protein